MRKTVNHRNRKLQDVAFFFLLTCAFVFLMWKCRFGEAKADEIFYLLTPYRLCTGDALIRHEWSLAQLSGVLTFPFVSAYLNLTGSTEGLVLAMRYFTIIVQTLVTGLIYLRIRKINWVGAAAASLCFVIYIPYGIMALSYKSMFVMLTMLTLTLLSTGEKKSDFIAGGLCYAGATLCCPYLAVLYFIYLAAVLIRAHVRGALSFKANDPYTPQNALYATIGIAIPAMALIAFVLSRASLESLFLALPRVLDDNHMSRTILYVTKRYIQKTLFFDSHTKYLYLPYAVILLIMFLDKDRKKRRALYFLPSAACVAGLMLLHQRTDYINFLMWSFGLIAVPAATLSDDPVCRRLLWTMWFPAMLFTFCMNAASDQGAAEISSTATMATFAGILMASVLISEMLTAPSSPFLSRACAVLFAGMLLFQLVTETDERLETVFWEAEGMPAQTVLLEEGVQKGVLVSQNSYDTIQLIRKELKVLEDYEFRKILYLTQNTSYYFMYDCEIASYSTWLSTMDDHTLRQLKAYYALNPDKMPDIVYARTTYQELAKKLGEEIGYEFRPVEGGCLLLPAQ